jgi:hypothetical protein
MRRLTLLVAAMLMVAACGSDTDAGEQGEITGITAQVSMDEAQSGNIENLAYVGTVVVRLPDVGAVTAKCSEACVSDIAGAPDFNVDEISGGFVATITITVDPPQDALLVQDETGEWEVIEILE